MCLDDTPNQAVWQQVGNAYGMGITKIVSLDNVTDFELDNAIIPGWYVMAIFLKNPTGSALNIDIGTTP